MLVVEKQRILFVSAIKAEPNTVTARHVRARIAANIEKVKEATFCVNGHARSTNARENKLLLISESTA
ncbi:MAG: hypothetical protein AMXMBFR56_67970 [Polyangiaceae bacterium]